MSENFDGAEESSPKPEEIPPSPPPGCSYLYNTNGTTCPSLISSKKRKCLNPNCISGQSPSYPKAPKYSVNYYGIEVENTTRNRHKIQYICPKCLEKAEQYLNESITALQEKKCFLTVNVPSQMENIVTLVDDDDSEDDEEGEKPEEIVEILDMEDMDEDPNDVYQKFLSSLNIEGQGGLCHDYLTVELDKLDEDCIRQECILENCQNEIERIRKTVLEHMAPEYTPVILRSVEIQEDGRVTSQDVLSDTNDNRAQYEDVIEICNKGKTSRPDPENRSNNNAAETEGKKYAPGDSYKLGYVPSETPAILPRMVPGRGRQVYIMRINQLSYWAKGIIMDISNSTTGLSLKEYKVLIEGTKKTPSQTKIVSGKHIAFSEPPPFMLPVGTRVIAKFDDEFKSEGLGASQYYAGIIAEKPAKMNNFRYLVFFDDGCAQYADWSQVLWVCESSPNVWEDVYPDSQDFIRRYVRTYPERPMVRLTEGQIITTEWNGTWNSGRVVEVDGSLAKFHFEMDRRYEWIYRGSTRLLPLWLKEMRLREQTLQARGRTKRRTHRLNPNEPKIEYNYFPGDFVKTGGQLDYVRLPLEGSAVKFVEYEGKMTKNKIPESIEGPANYVDHICGPNCIRPYNDSSDEYKGLSPLQLPFYLGFARETFRVPRRDVAYKAPCGKALRDIDEMYQFLRITNYNLGIDHFCFDFSVDVLKEFNPGKTYYTIEDCSFGKEATPIKCVNSIDNDFPESMVYSKDRIPGKGVTLNLDPAFLTCCDCEDDCWDKEKCACWQMTIQGAQGVPSIATTFEHQIIGYQNKRLMEHVASGIYECNSKCKCKKTCLNRVVQHDLQWPLQLFKTATKGWALRPLYDIPIGSFICIYAGQILTDQVANEDGQTFGDEYFAELDFIEVLESAKEGYEAEAVGPGLDQTGKGKKQSNLNGSSLPIRNNSSTRELFGDEDCYIMDAKSIGNIGRYLNHSCAPNVIVQNVFVDTHDLRFPWIAFFAFKHIKAGTELTWDYSYDIGSVSGKKMYCYCGAPECRGRLL